MILLEKQIEKLLKDAVLSFDPNFENWDKLFIQKASNANFGDFQTNFAMMNAKTYKKNPRMIAQELIDNLPENEILEKVEIAGPGFINLYVKNSCLESYLKGSNPQSFEYDFLNREGDVVIDYSSPNIAKRMHIGHLRSTVIGDSIKRLFKFLGYNVIADNHIGDWGTQYGKLIIGYRKWLNQEAFEKNPIEELERVYVEFAKQSEDNKELEDQARLELKKLQNGDEENMRLWKEFIDASLLEYDKTYKRLDIEFDTFYGESFYHDRMPGVVELLKEKKIATEDDGANVVFFAEEDNLHPCIVQKKDGAFLYASSDLATLQFKKETYNLNQAIYVTDERQQSHFKQVFKISEMLEWDIKKAHIWFGIMRFADGIFSTRKGNVIRLEELLDEAVKRVREIIEEKNPNLSEEEKANVAEVVGVGAIKYSDLSQNRQSTVIFDWNKMLSFEGNTGPYLQYTYARIQSILRKATEKGYATDQNNLRFTCKEERALAANLLYFPNEVVKAASNYKPNFISDYLYELAQKFNSFYNAVPILKDNEREIIESRLALIMNVAEYLKTGLNLLGIGVVERM